LYKLTPELPAITSEFIPGSIFAFSNICIAVKRESGIADASIKYIPSGILKTISFGTFIYSD
jgi:hypothetical protein